MRERNLIHFPSAQGLSLAVWLQQARAQASFGILHLATHGEFKPGKLSNSYIQFWDTQLTLDQLLQLKLNDPP